MMLAWVDAMLCEWGDWMRRSDDGGLGYPSQTVEYRLMREGAGASIRSTARSTVLSMPETVERVEAVILRMEPKHRQAVKLKYYRGVPDVTAAREAGMSVGSYRRTLEQVHWYVAGNLENTTSSACA